MRWYAKSCRALNTVNASVDIFCLVPFPSVTPSRGSRYHSPPLLHYQLSLPRSTSNSKPPTGPLEPPAPAACSRRGAVVVLGDSRGVAAPPLVQARGAAREEDDDGAEQRADAGDQDRPDAHAVVGMRVVVLVVDVVADQGEEDKVADQHDHRHHKRDERRKGG